MTRLTRLPHRRMFPTTPRIFPTRSRLTAALFALLALFLISPAHAQSTNQLFMTGTGSGSTPTIFANGVDSNVGMLFSPKGTGGITLGATTTVSGNLTVTGTCTGCGGAGAASLSTLTSGTATNTIDNTLFAQTWKWGTLSTQTALTFTTSSMTTGTLHALSNTSTIANAGTVLSVSNSQAGGSFGISSTMLSTTNTGYAVYGTNASTGVAYGVYGTITGHNNTGYAGYFTNTDTGGANYGLYASTSSAGGYGLYAYGVSTGVYGAGLSEGVYGNGGNVGGGVGVLGGNAANGSGNYGVEGVATGTGTVTGVYGTATTHGNTGYAGYFTNTDTGGVNYGLYASTSSTTGYAGYFQGNVYVTGTTSTNLLTLTSDRRLKKNIQSLDSEAALDEIAALRPVSFAWKKSGEPDMGLIAQEIKTIFPQLVRQGDDDKLSLEYISLFAPVIASIQELKKRNDEAEAENQALRRDFETYKQFHP